MNVPVGSVAGRRARLARRHLLLPGARVDTVAGVCDALVGLHSSDPVTVYLSAASRLTSPAIGLIDDELWVADGDDEDELAPGPWVALLPGLDPTVMGWKQRQWYLPDDHVADLFDRNGNAGPTIWVDGRVVGGWAQCADGKLVHRLFERISAPHERLLQIELDRLREFVGDTRFTTRFPSPLSRELSA
jgi:hypothetical protein